MKPFWQGFFSIFESMGEIIGNGFYPKPSRRLEKLLEESKKPVTWENIPGWSSMPSWYEKKSKDG